MTSPSYAALLARRFMAASTVFVLLGLAASACRDATEIRLHVSTNVPCTDPASWKGVAVYVGAPGADVESKAPALTTTACDANGQVGTLVVVPSGSKDAEVGIKVVAGLSVGPEECAAHNYQGCIVSRRSLRFTAHDNVDLDVPLTSDCVNLSCDAEHTCVDGSCADSATATVVLDPLEPSVRCGDNGIRCPTSGDVCCLTVDAAAGTTTGECKPGGLCASPNVVLNCDDSSQCGLGPDGSQLVCAISYDVAEGAPNSHFPGTVSTASCVEGFSQRLELCGARRGCTNVVAACHTSVGYPQNALPGYFWCED
jgi:hypothetical protein